MARYEKESIRIYDEPISYDKFAGGINNTPSNESMSDNELRDAINWHYNETVLERRLGARIIADLSNLDLCDCLNTERLQGTFIYGIGTRTYVLVAVDGKIFYSIITKDMLDAIDYTIPPLEMIELEIPVTSTKLVNFNGGGAYNITGSPSNEAEGLVMYNNLNLAAGTIPDIHNGYLYTDKTNSNKTTLRFQNTKPVEGIGIKSKQKVNGSEIVEDEFRLASGTRLIRAYEENNVLKAMIIQPEVPTGWEYRNLGVNKLSPYPLQLVEGTHDIAATGMSVILAGHLKKEASATNLSFNAILDYAAGKTSKDYYFRWDAMVLSSTNVPESGWVIINDGTQRTFSDTNSKGLDKLTDVKVAELNGTVGKKIRVRCTFAEGFETISNLNASLETETAIVTETLAVNTNSSGSYTLGSLDDYKIDALKSFGSTYVTIEIVANGTVPTPEPDSEFLNIHSCRKILSDGNNVIVYGDKSKTGGWYKAIIEKYNYITDKGGLNFQTNKNEELIKAINFEGNIVCFAYNEEIGGNISVVLGSGDDYDDGSGYYSPYRRKIANTNITTDHPNTVQVVENNLIFKFRDTIYLIDSKQLDADRIDVMSVNDKLKHYTWLKDSSETFDTDSMVQMPNIHNNALFGNVAYEQRVYSEVTEDYYALIFPVQKLRWKMYFKLPIKYQGDPKTYYPWLRDTSENAFDIRSVFYLKGISTMVTKNGKIIQFTSLDYKDLGTDTYSSKIITKAYDLGYPKFIKYLNTLNVYYYRDYSQVFTLDVELKNEADHDIYGLVYKASHEYAEDDNKDTIVDRIIYKGVQPIDKELLVADRTTLDNAILGPQPRYTSKVFTPINMSPFLSISVVLTINDATNVTLGSLGFTFVTAQNPDESMQNYYGNIIKF